MRDWITEHKAMLENLTSVQARCTELLLENRELKAKLASSLILPGWDCPDCKCFNGEAKERLENCRYCNGKRV